jgi:hypothetical protein
VNKFAQGFLFELRKSGAKIRITGTSKIAPMQAKLVHAAPDKIQSTVGITGTKSMKSPIASPK